jgi:hypothetical protein
MSLASSAKKTSATSSYRMEMRLRISLPGVADRVEMTATGSADLVRKRQALTMDMSGLLGALPAGGSGIPDASDLKVEAVIDGTDMYMRMPFLTQMLPAGKTWISIDVADLAKGTGADFSSLLGRSYTDPSQYLAYLTSVTGPVEEVGTESVRGVETRHVRANLDLAKYVAGLDEKSRVALAPAVDQFEQLIGTVKPVVDAWVDGDGFVRRIGLDMSMDLSAMTGASGVGAGALGMTMTVDLFDFGTDVNIEVPQAAEVADGTQLGLGG